MDTSELIKKVRRIEIKSRGLSNNIFAGEYHSAFKGRGMMFSEVREYAYGDDIRKIDWNVTARYNRPFIKTFEEERELTVMLLVDVSGSRMFGSGETLKKNIITEVSAVLAFSAITNNDKIGVIFFSDTIEKFIPPKKGRGHILRIISDMIEFEPKSKKTNLAEALRYLTNVIKRRCTTFVISDFIDDGFEHALSIAGRKHDLVALQLYDVRERELPTIGLVKIHDAETGKSKWLNTYSRKVRTQYKARFLEQSSKLKETFLRSGVDHAEIEISEGYLKALRLLFNRRTKR